MKSRITTLLKLIFTVVLLSFLIARSDVPYLIALLTSLKFSYLGLVFCLIAFDALLRSYNWGLLLQIRGSHLPLWQLLYSYMVGNFFGTFVPSSFGTDLGRGVVLTRHYAVRAEETTLALIMVNLMNLLALSLCAFLGMVSFRHLLGEHALVIIVIAFCLAYLVAFPFLLNGWLLRPIQTLVSLTRIQRLVTLYQKFAIAFQSYAVRKDRLAVVLLFSLLSQGITILVTYTVSLSLNLDISLVLFAMLVPILTLSRMLPLSIAGLGAEQGIFVYLFSLVAVPAEQAFSISLIIVAAILCFTALGGVVYMIEKFKGLFDRTRSAALVENSPK